MMDETGKCKVFKGKLSIFQVRKYIYIYHELNRLTLTVIFTKLILTEKICFILKLLKRQFRIQCINSPIHTFYCQNK